MSYTSRETKSIKLLQFNINEI